MPYRLSLNLPGDTMNFAVDIDEWLVTASKDTARVWFIQLPQGLIALANTRVPRKEITGKEKCNITSSPTS